MPSFRENVELNGAWGISAIFLYPEYIAVCVWVGSVGKRWNMEKVEGNSVNFQLERKDLL